MLHLYLGRAKSGKTAAVMDAIRARVIARELQKAEKSKNAAVAQAREEGRAEAMSGIVSGETSPEASAEVTSETPVSDFPDTSAPQL